MLSIKTNTWEKLGRILTPDKNIYWMSTHTGSSFAVQIDDSSFFDIYVTGRDSMNRSLIGRVRINIENPKEVLDVTPDPVFGLGSLGAFDENGVGYPYIVKNQGKVYMYYVGWMPSVLTPVQNHLGLAIQNKDGFFSRYSRAPIMERNNDDYLSIGSACVLIDSSIWKMWYTSYIKWEITSGKPKHYYLIKYAESKDGVKWVRKNQICINYEGPNEYAIAKPSVIKLEDGFHMWYSYRGDKYRIGYATSSDGIKWTRKDHLVGIDVSSSGWDSESICYPYVFKYKDYFFMLYSGNDYGKEGLGLARFKL